MKTQIKSEYDIQAETFLQEAGITFKAVFLFHGPHWEGDKDQRDVYTCILEREGKPSITFQFGQSIFDSSKYYRKLGTQTLIHESKFTTGHAPAQIAPSYLKSDKEALNRGWTYAMNKPKAPNAYSLLASIQKYDPDTFENFCSEYGYDTDSRKAEKTYFAVQEEWNKVRRFFSQEEIEKLQEIN